jgi:hypothetical protein
MLKRKIDYFDSDDSDDSDFNDSYSESIDLNSIKDTILKCILKEFPERQQTLIGNRVKKGIDNSIEIFNDILEPIAETKSWKLGLTKDEINKYEEQLTVLRKDNNKKYTLLDILNLNTNDNIKKRLLKIYDNLEKLDEESDEYNEELSNMNLIINNLNNDLISTDSISDENNDLKNAILNSDIPIIYKKVIYEKYLQMEKLVKQSSEEANLKQWLYEVLKTPFGKFISHNNTNTPGQTLINLKNAFENELSHMDNVLEPLLSIFNNKFTNPNSGSLVLGLVGNPGVGKCLGINTPILMYDGSIKLVQDIKVGDKLMGDDFLPRNVLSTCSGIEQMYKIYQEYGITYRVNASHILTVKLVDRVKNYKSAPIEKLMDINVVNYLESNFYRNYYGGCKASVDGMYIRLDVDAYQVGQNQKFGSIPKNILLNTVLNRQDFLKGYLSVNTLLELEDVLIVDLCKNNFSDFERLIFSLGGLVSLQDNKMHITKNYSNSAYTIIIEKDIIDNYYGFTIDGNHRFLLGDYTITHNTSIGKVISDVLKIPYQQICFGGLIDSSIIKGQHQSWVGSGPGRIVKSLQQMDCMNGLIFLDEIDKLGNTNNGMEVQYSLLNILDPTQNTAFYDNYLGPKLPIDLSKCIFICAMNKLDGIDSALLNRMHIINIPNYTKSQQLSIMKKHIFKSLLKKVNLSDFDIVLKDDGAQAILDLNNGDGGMRTIKSILSIIIDKLNILLHTTPEEQKQLDLTYKNSIDNQRPVQLNKELVNKLYSQNISNNSKAPSTLYI